MSWWNAKYKNDHDEYEITFGSHEYEKAKAVEKACCAVIDNRVNSPTDVEIVRHGRWNEKCVTGFSNAFCTSFVCSECEKSYRTPNMNYCPNCGAKMEL